MQVSMPNTEELDLFTFFEMTPDLVCIATKEGYFKKVNQAVITKLGYNETEIYAQPIRNFIHPADREMTSAAREGLLQGNALTNLENRYVSKSGKSIWLHWTSVYIPDKELVFAIAKDISDRKKVEKEIHQKMDKFKGLAYHFKNSAEKDRKYFSDELHEELAQLASVIKMDLGWIRNNSQELPENAISKIDHASMVSEMMINTIRKIAFSISPYMLDSLGLNETLSWLCRDFNVLHKITCVFESTCIEEDIPKGIKLDFFRICQESLQNIFQTGRSSYVEILLEGTGECQSLTIFDNEEGLEQDQEKETAFYKSLLQRVASFDGEINYYVDEQGRKIIIRSKC